MMPYILSMTPAEWKCRLGFCSVVPLEWKTAVRSRRRQTSQFQFLECRRRHGGNLRPMLDHFRREASRFADFPVGGVVLELERKEFEGKGVEFIFVAADVRRL